MSFLFFCVVFKEHCLKNKDKNGGDEENRTPDPLLARQVLSQLSYAPMSGYALFSIILFIMNAVIF